MPTPVIGGPKDPCYPMSSPGVSNAIGGQLRRDHGDQAVTSMRDPRINNLHGYYVQGWESAFKLPGAESLGKDWKEVPTKKEPGKLYQPIKYVLEKEGASSRQEVLIKMYDSVTLSSTATV